MKTIVVPVNFSASSDNAARYAADMARAIDANLHLIHVIQIPASTAEIPTTEYVFEEMQNSAAEGLRLLREELVKRTDKKVDIFVHVDAGSLVYRINEFCAHSAPFVVVMGNSGNSSIHHLPYPLIFVPENAAFHFIKKIVLACDLDDIAGGVPVASSILKELRDSFGSIFEVINICTASQYHQNEAEAAFEFDCWKDKLHKLYPEVHFVRMKKIDQGIGEYLDSHPADLVLVFPKKHNILEFHSSYSKKIALHSKVPVMSIHS